MMFVLNSGDSLLSQPLQPQVALLIMVVLHMGAHYMLENPLQSIVGGL